MLSQTKLWSREGKQYKTLTRQQTKLEMLTSHSQGGGALLPRVPPGLVQGGVGQSGHSDHSHHPQLHHHQVHCLFETYAN